MPTSSQLNVDECQFTTDDRSVELTSSGIITDRRRHDVIRCG
jgi:hypothetical protein